MYSRIRANQCRSLRTGVILENHLLFVILARLTWTHCNVFFTLDLDRLLNRELQ